MVSALEIHHSTYGSSTKMELLIKVRGTKIRILKTPSEFIFTRCADNLLQGANIFLLLYQ